MRLLFAIVAVAQVSAQTWCGKNYMATSPIVPPGGEFPEPNTSDEPLLAFRCSPALKPYLPEDKLANIIVDARLTSSQVKDAATIAEPTAGGVLNVVITGNGELLGRGNVIINSTGTEIPFPLSQLVPRTENYEIACSATYHSATTAEPQNFQTTTVLAYLPAPSNGASVTKMDLRTGALLARPADGKGGPYEPVFSIGFYTQFDNYLAKNLSVLNDLAFQGFTIVHPVPSFDNLTVLDAVLDRMQELGLYLMYDMRGTYMNSTSVTEQVNSIKSRPNLLLWYTADEPDGTSDPLDATANAYDLIKSLDGGGYHPVSLVLNCENFQYNEYTRGSDVVLQDTYMIGNNVTFSSQWGTVCTKDYGDCGCDNCVGVFEDISNRMDEFRHRLFVNGWERSKAVWAVPQAFGNETYWKRYPTGKEFVVQSILGINHGALGIIPWDDPTPAGIKKSASLLAKSLPAMARFLFSHEAAFSSCKSPGRIDVGTWTLGSDTLVLATNLNYASASLALTELPNQVGIMIAKITQVLDSGASTTGDDSIEFESVGSGAFVLTREARM